MLTTSIFLIFKSCFCDDHANSPPSYEFTYAQLLVYFRLPTIFINYMEVNFHKISEAQIAKLCR